MVIIAWNPPTDELEKTYLSLAVSAGATSLTVKNNDDFTSGARFQIGENGREKTEILTIQSTPAPGTLLTSSSLVFPHSADDPVYLLRYDQVKFYRSTTTSTGTYTLLATVGIDADSQDLQTVYDDLTGLATYYYQVSYYNSVTLLESTKSDPVLGGGFPRNSVGFMVDEIMREVGDEHEQFVTRSEILGWFNEVNDDLLTRTSKPYDFLHTRTTAARVANDTSGSGTYLAFPTNMWKLDRLDYNLIDTTVTPNSNVTYIVRYKPPQEFRDLYDNSYNAAGTTNTNNSDTLQFYTLDTAVNRIRLYPPSLTSSGGVYYIYYWKTFTELNSEADVFETPTPRLYKNFSLGKFYRKKAANDSSYLNISDRFFADYNSEVGKLKRADNKNAGQPKGFRQLPQTFKGNRRF